MMRLTRLACLAVLTLTASLLQADTYPTSNCTAPDIVGVKNTNVSVTVPAGCHYVKVKGIGCGGNSTAWESLLSSTGAGGGGFVRAIFKVNPGDTLVWSAPDQSQNTDERAGGCAAVLRYGPQNAVIAVAPGGGGAGSSIGQATAPGAGGAGGDVYSGEAGLPGTYLSSTPGGGGPGNFQGHGLGGTYVNNGGGFTVCTNGAGTPNPNPMNSPNSPPSLAGGAGHGYYNGGTGARCNGILGQTGAAGGGGAGGAAFVGGPGVIPTDWLTTLTQKGSHRTPGAIVDPDYDFPVGWGGGQDDRSSTTNEWIGGISRWTLAWDEDQQTDEGQPPDETTDWSVACEIPNDGEIHGVSLEDEGCPGAYTLNCRRDFNTREDVVCNFSCNDNGETVVNRFRLGC